MGRLDEPWHEPQTAGRFARPPRRTLRILRRIAIPVILICVVCFQLSSYRAAGPSRRPWPAFPLGGPTDLDAEFAGVVARPTTTPGDELPARRPSFIDVFTRVVDSFPDETEAERLLSQIKGTGTSKIREVGLRARKYKQYFEAWEELHLSINEQDGNYVRDDVVQHLRRHFRGLDPASAEPIGGGLAQAVRSYEDRRQFLAKFGHFLFPWTAPYFPDHRVLHSHFRQSGRGIVFTAGDAGAPFMLTSILALRRLGCSLPIEIMYLGDSDLGEHHRARFERLDGVLTRDISRMVNDEGWTLSGWAAKPFAILLSSFREVIFIDADSLFFRDPEILFDDPGYVATGALFYRDRVMLAESKKAWLQKLLPEPISQQVKQNRYWTGESGHMQESGVVVVDKWKHFVALLMVARLNGPDRNGDSNKGTVGMYDMVHGDKETFWLGWELVGDLDYVFHEGDAGALGVFQESEEGGDEKGGRREAQGGKGTAAGDAAEAGEGVAEKGTTDRPWTMCAPQLLHLDLDRRPLWFNGWLLENKFAETDKRRFSKFEHFLIEPRDGRQPEAWQLKENNLCCLTAETRFKGTFTLEEEKALNMMLELAREANATIGL
ncbi:hypothetical protein CDD83_567 [Cordyceps sp. RAO-2017]|nr:hypothetical protein CDD83_567 [Cordyceps sp. RAO-2017]